MDIVERKGKKFKALKRSLLALPFRLRRSKFTGGVASFLSKSKSCSSFTTAAKPFSGGNQKENQRQVAPEGCFSVYVGPEKQRFVVKTDYANHPLFKMLLEDAELEYGFNSEGPILLPCDVDLFYKVLAEMDNSGEDIQYSIRGFAYGSCSPFSPTTRFRAQNHMTKGYGSYGLLSPSRLLKMNRF